MKKSSETPRDDDISSYFTNQPFRDRRGTMAAGGPAPADMSLEQAILEAIHALPPEKQREIFDYASRLRAETTKKPPFRSIEGLWDELGVALSAEEIEENQREMW